jgi:hypothetical protein
MRKRHKGTDTVDVEEIARRAQAGVDDGDGSARLSCNDGTTR